MNKPLLLAVVAAACSIPAFAGTDFTETNITNLFTDLNTNCPSGGCTVTIPSTATGYLPSSTQNVTVPFVTFECKAGAVLATPSGANFTPIYVKASNVTFRGCTFDNTRNSSTNDAMVVVGSSILSGTTLASDYFINDKFVGSSTVASAINILAYQSNGLEIDDFVVTDCKFTNGGLFAHNGSINGFKFTNNDVMQKPGNGTNTALALHTEVVGAVMNNIVISNNNFHDQGQFATELQAVAGSSIQNISFNGNNAETLGSGYGTGYSFDGVTHAAIAGNTNDTHNFQPSSNTNCLEIVNAFDVNVSALSCNGATGSNTSWGAGISINKSSRVSVSNATVYTGGRGGLYVGGSTDATHTDDITISDSHFYCVDLPSTSTAHCAWAQNNAPTSTIQRFHFHDNYIKGNNKANGIGLLLQSNGVAGYQSFWDLSKNYFDTLNYGVDPGTTGFYGDIADFRNIAVNLGSGLYTGYPSTSTTWHIVAW